MSGSCWLCQTEYDDISSLATAVTFTATLMNSGMRAPYQYPGGGNMTLFFKGGNISKVVPKPTLINPRATLAPNHVAETGPRLIAPLEAETPEKQPQD